MLKFRISFFDTKNRTNAITMFPREEEAKLVITNIEFTTDRLSEAATIYHNVSRGMKFNLDFKIPLVVSGFALGTITEAINTIQVTYYRWIQ